MRYIFLIYEEEQRMAADGNRESRRVRHESFAAESRGAGVYVAGEAFQPTLTATTLSMPNGKRILDDGPAVDYPLALSGFYVLDVADERDALRWASKIPGAASGAVEVRLARLRR